MSLSCLCSGFPSSLLPLLPNINIMQICHLCNACSIPTPSHSPFSGHLHDVS
jgi:hypothetical protein